MGMNSMVSLDQRRFLDALAHSGMLSTAAAAAKIPLAVARQWMESDETFQEGLADARMRFRERVASEAVRRGVDGVRRPVMYKGEEQYRRDPETGALLLDDDFEAIPLIETDYSDTLLRAMLFERDEVMERRPEEEPEEEPDILDGGVEIRLIPSPYAGS